MDRLSKIITDYRSDFHTAYHRDVLPLLMEMEPQRKAKLRGLVFWEVIMFAVVVFLYWVGAKVDCIGFVGSMLMIIVMVYVAQTQIESFKKKLKEKCMPALTSIFGKIDWTPNLQMMPTVELVNSKLFSDFNNRINDDSFNGTYKGVEFCISEMKLLYRMGSGKNRREAPVFKGVVMNFTSNKKVKAHTVVVSKGDTGSFKSPWVKLLIFGAPALQIASFAFFYPQARKYVLIGLLVCVVLFLLWHVLFNTKHVRFDKINLEDPLFESKFNVYSKDEVEARYLVTTAFMERFLKLNTAFGAKHAKCAFFDNNIMFAIATDRNLFEIGDLFHRLGNTKKISQFFEELSSILTLVEHFKLNENIGL